MAGPNGNQDMQNMVFENLGMEPEDLGVEDQGLEGLEADDAGDDAETEAPQQDDQDTGQLDDFEARDPSGRSERTGQEGNNGRGRPGRDQFGRRDTRRDAQPGYQPFTRDRQGNLVDTATNRIVAKAGKEARMYQDAFTARQQATHFEGQTRHLNGQLRKAVDIATAINKDLDNYKAREQEIRGLGLGADEHLDALKLAAQSKKDPLGTAKVLLTRAAAMGIDLTKLGISGNGGDLKPMLDMVQQRIDEGMRPLRDREAQDRQLQEQNQNVERVKAHTEQFFRENPDAQKHIPVFMRVLGTPGLEKMPLNEIWLRIQLAQNQMPRQDAGRNNNTSRSRPQRGMTNGKARPSTGNSDMAPTNASYESILRGVFDEVGDITRPV